MNETYNTEYLLDTENIVHILDAGYNSITQCMEFMRKTLYTSENYYLTISGMNGRSMQRVSSVGAFYSRLHNFPACFKQHGVFHPLLDLFFKSYRTHPISEYTGIPPGMSMAQGKKGFEIYDEFLNHIRCLAIEQKTKKKVSDWESKLKKNRRRLISFEEELFQRCGRVLAIRLDLEYRSTIFTKEQIQRFVEEDKVEQVADHDAYWSGVNPSEPALPHPGASIEQVQRDRNRFFSNIKGKPTLFKHLVGYVWRIHFGKHTGYHLHVALFFDGAEVQNDKWLAHRIGEYWVSSTTKGRGRFQNVNWDWNTKSPCYGIGMINHYETAKRSNLLNRALAYLCVDKQHVHVLPYPGCNLFGAGFIHRAKSGTRGRPRTKTAQAMTINYAV